MNIGNIISEKRKKLGLSQEKLGALLGVSNQAVSKWENGTTAPDIYLLPQIAATLKITLNELFGIEDQKKVSQKTTADTYPEAAFDVPENWLGVYFPSSIPEGFVFADAFEDPEMPSIEYTGNDGKSIYFFEYECLPCLFCSSYKT